MATFSNTSFSASSYAVFRPSYPPSLYASLLSYHRGPSTTLLDLGCGHGLISRALSPSFKHVYATDPSSTMIAQANASSPSSEYPNIQFYTASAEHLSWLEEASVDMLVAGQAAHWFDFTKVWTELARVVKAGGTLAFWGYKDNVLLGHPAANKVLDYWCYGESEETMGPFWEQPGRTILRNLYRDIEPPESDWHEVVRSEYEPAKDGNSQREAMLKKTMKLGELDRYWKTFSAYHRWREAFPERKPRKEGGGGDVMDEMWDDMARVDPGLMEGDWREREVESEWGSVMLMARRK